MLIGVDASRAAFAERTGTENYSLHLIRGLLSLGSEHSFRLYFNQAPPDDLFAHHAERRIIPFPRLWTHFRLSWEMAWEAPDLLFVPAHVLPLVRPRCCVATVHDLGFHYFPEAHTPFQNAYLRWATRFNARCAARVLADSEATRQDLIRLCGTAESKIVVVYPGCDESLAPVTDPAMLAAVCRRYGLTKHYLLYVGSLQPRKNLVRLVEAFASLHESRPADKESPIADLQLVLAGPTGWLFDEILDRITHLGLSDRVVVTGYVPTADLASLLSGALAFVFPSLYEGFGLPVLEAMACGTPVVCSNVSSLPEVAGNAALLVDPLDTEALVEALARIVSDPGLRRELVQRGFRQAKRFSWRRCARETLQVLENAGSECY
jgi:glycosyltransferase involved in cell wall biosynthesis